MDVENPDGSPIKNGALAYVKDENVKPEIVPGNASRKQISGISRIKRPNLILSLHQNLNKLKNVKRLERDVWYKLQSIFRSKESARKTTLLKRLTLQHMEKNDVRTFSNILRPSIS